MKITYHRYNAVGSWRWDLKPIDASSSKPGDGDQNTLQDEDGNVSAEEQEDDDDEEEEDEVCGICQLEFESSCPGCKIPGDDCPLSQCRASPWHSSVARLICVLSNGRTKSVGSVHPCLSHALPVEMVEHGEQ
jgi:hypothetical protein